MQVVAAVLVVVVTAWYAILTHWIMKATRRQASGVLQPVLSLKRLVRAEGETHHRLLIENPSERPIVFLDVFASCHPGGHRAIVHKLRQFDGQILSPKDHVVLELDFVKELAAIRVPEDLCGFYTQIVVSDLGRQVTFRYSYIWVLGCFYCEAGLPWRTWWRYRVQPWGWRYFRAKRLFHKRPATRRG